MRDHAEVDAVVRLFRANRPPTYGRTSPRAIPRQNVQSRNNIPCAKGTVPRTSITDGRSPRGHLTSQPPAPTSDCASAEKMRARSGTLPRYDYRKRRNEINNLSVVPSRASKIARDTHVDERPGRLAASIRDRGNGGVG